MGKPYIVPDSWTKTPSQASGTAYTIDLPPAAVAGDYIGVWIVQDLSGATTITESSGSAFTFLGTQVTTGALRTAYCFDPAATGGGSDVLTVACNSTAIWAVSWLVRGHHATQPHGASPASGTDFVYSVAATVGTTGLQAGAMTTTDANTLNMYLVGMDAGGSTFRCAANEAVFPIVYWDAAIAGGVGYNPATSTTAVRPTFYGAPSTEGIQILSIAIRWDGVTDCGQPYCESNLVELDWLSSISANNPAMAPTWGAIDSTTIDGLTTNTATVTLAYPALANPDTGISFETVANMTYGGAGTAIADPGAWVGKKLTFGSAKDLTNQILNLAWMTPHVSTIAHVGEKGIAIRLTDGTNWVAYTIEEKATFIGGALKNVQIELGVATELDHSGTVASALSGCTEIEFLWHRTGNVTTTGNFNFSNLVAFDRDTPATIRGGGAASPASAIAYAEAMQSFNQFRLVGLQSEAQVMARGSLMIGDGTNDLYWDSLAGALAWPKPYNGASQDFWRVADNKVGLYLNPITGDTIKLRAGSLVAPGLQIFEDKAGSSITSVTRDFGGQVFVGMAPTLRTGATYANATFSRCGPVAAKGATLNNITINNTLAGSGEGAVSFDTNSTTQENNTIDITGSAAGYFAAFGASITAVEWNNNTLTGTPASGYKFFSSLASGVLTITTDGTGTALVDTDVEFVGGSTATADIAAPALYQEVVITGLATTYRLQIFDIEYVLTVSGITVTPTAGATYTHNGITWTVRSASIVAGSGTITVYGTGTPAASGTLTKTGGTGDASVAFSAYAVDGTELYIGVPAATSYTWTDSVAAAAPRVIRVRVMEDGPGTSDAILMIDSIVGMCGITEGAESVGYLVAAVADDVYNDRGVDGSTITGITIDDTTLRLEIASGTIVNYGGTDVLVVDGRDLYAYETYWLGTTDGMRDEARFIEAVDAVNFRCSGFKLLGTSGYPIAIRNCFMVDAATGVFASMVDYSGDPISNHPEHMAAIVVSTSDAVISGTAAEIIAAIPSAATNAGAVRTELATELADITKARKLAQNKKVLDPATGVQKVYDDDGTTVLGQGNAYMDADGTELYDGGGPVHRTERLT